MLTTNDDSAHYEVLTILEGSVGALGEVDAPAKHKTVGHIEFKISCADVVGVGRACSVE